MAVPASGEVARSAWDRASVYGDWIASQGVPIHRGYYAEDLRTIEVSRWERRGCNAAFLALDGQGGVNEIRITEIPADSSTKPARLAVDEIVFVLQGRGTATLSSGHQHSRSFEWQKHSLFLVPRHAQCQLSNASSGPPARLLHYNALPLALTAVPDPEFLVDNDYQGANLLVDEEGIDLYGEARLATPGGTSNRDTYTWRGNFFPDMGAWDKLRSYGHRGAGRQVVWVNYSHTALWNHVSVVDPGTYEKAHHRGLGPLTLFLEGEGYSYLWKDGDERSGVGRQPAGGGKDTAVNQKVVVPWHEASATVPPEGWFHQTFNAGSSPARYLGFHTPLDDNEHVQIEYADEDPSIRQAFDAELAKHGLSSQMPPEMYSR